MHATILEQWQRIVVEWGGVWMNPQERSIGLSCLKKAPAISHMEGIYTMHMKYQKLFNHQFHNIHTRFDRSHIQVNVAMQNVESTLLSVTQPPTHPPTLDNVDCGSILLRLLKYSIFLPCHKVKKPA